MWGLYSSEGVPIPPRQFTSGRTQEELLEDIIKEFDCDSKIVLLNGGVGSGKSIVGATVAGALGRGIINVPVKPLQEQYKRDYEGRLNIRIGRDPLKIRMLKGRSNFQCRKNPGQMCSYKELVCTMPLPDSIARSAIGVKCRYWSPIYRHSVKALDEDSSLREIHRYLSIDGEQRFYQRHPGCGYYEQNLGYVNADVLVYNNAKWHVDTVIGQKPRVDVEIFDEADHFLDSLNLRLNLSSRMFARLHTLTGKEVQKLRTEGNVDHGAKLEKLLDDATNSFEDFMRSKKTQYPYYFNDEPDAEKLLKTLVSFLLALGDEYSDNLRLRLEELLKYKDVAAYYTESDKGNDKITFFVPEPSKVLADRLLRSSKRILLMSATLQEEAVLRDVYGLKDYTYLEGETQIPGTIHLRLGDRYKVNYRNWQRPRFQEQYWTSLSRMIAQAHRPTLVQVHSYKYLPPGNGYEHLPSKDDLREMAQDTEIIRFKKGEIDLLFSTKTDRGTDLPGDMCRSIVIMKYPYPSLNDPMFLVMKRKLGEKAFQEYYRDIAKRDLIQQIGRGLRSMDDWIEVWTPDAQVHRTIRNLEADVKETGQANLGL